MKKIINNAIYSICILLCINTVVSQERVKATFGEPTAVEKALVSYDKDPEAAGVVLFESGYNTFEVIDNYVRLVKKVHRKIKVLDASRFEHTTVTIPYYKTNRFSERVEDLKIITHNGSHKQFVGDQSIFDVDLNKNWGEKRFTFANVKDGSILEYKYTIISPYFFNFEGWEFQGELPKIYSEFSADIPGNYVYRRSLIGTKKLDINDISIKKSCFYVPGTAKNADCDSAVYAMFDVPAYKEESYMLSADNYKSRIAYQLQETYNFKGERTEYSREWDDVDKEFRTEKDIGKQLKNTKFFKDNLPTDILGIPDELERAKAVYHFIQDHFSWDGKYRIFSEIRVKKAFEEKQGNIAEINLALINALQAAKIETYLVLSSTRKNGVPSSVYPVLTEFNYVLAFVKIGEQKILLDATNKLLAFGLLPFKTLNVKARVMDFKNGSYWMPIQPELRNLNYIKIAVTAQDDEVLTGNIERIYNGYRALQRRHDILSVNTQDDTSSEETLQIEVYDLTQENIGKRDEPLKESGTIDISIDAQGDALYLYPFLLNDTYIENPFKKEQRQYAINFGYPIQDTYLLKIDLNGIFEVEELPTNKKYNLPDNLGGIAVSYSVNQDILECSFSLNMRAYQFPASAYPTLKQFFSHLVTQKANTPIKLKLKK